MRNNILRFLRFLLFLFFLAACSAKIPQNSELTQNIPQRFNNMDLISIKQESALKDSTPQEQIKRLFNDSTLNSLFDIALEKNLDVQITSTRILQARAQLKSAWGDLFPKINGSLNANESHTRANSKEITTNSTQASATLSWEVDLFGKLQHAKNAKLSLYQKSLQDLENVRITLLVEVADAYFNLLEIHKNLALTNLNIGHYKDALEFTRLKVENGLLDSTELFEKQDLLTDEQNIKEQLQISLEEYKNALLILLDSTTLPFSLQNQQMPQIVESLSLNALPADVLFSRPDIKASLFSLYAQIYNKANAKASLFPILSISANISDILDSNTQNAGNLVWQFAASLSAPLLNRTQLTQNYFLQDALLSESYLTLEKSLKAAFFEIENASFSLKSTQLQLQNNLKRLNNAESYYEFSYNRHSIGLIDSLDHALNSASLNNAKKSFNTTKGQNLKALSLLYKTLGGNLNL